MKRPNAPNLMPKRSIQIGGHKTSTSMEPEFWTAFKELAKRRGMLLATLAAEIDCARDPKKQNLSSAIRVYVVKDAMRRAMESDASATVLRITIKKLIDDRDSAAKTTSGLAPVSAVIAARGRPNA